VVVFAEHIILNAGRLWQEFSLEQKQRLQQLLFPVGVTYADGEFRTVEMSPIFRMLRVADGEGETEVSPMVPSWNQLLGWLRDVDLLRKLDAA
jgi:hypothetical protein